MCLKCVVCLCMQVAIAAKQYVRGWGCKSPSGRTALMRAAVGGHADCARLLIDAGADKDAKSRVRVHCFSL